MKTKLLTFCFGLLLSCLFAQAQTPAFPGAEGFGRHTSGGRGGDVYHVTRLDDDGKPGSLRYAVNQSGARTIVFDVAGTIYLKSELRLQRGNVTIAGQTSPGGICVGGFPFVIQCDNVIIRYMSFRLGADNKDKHEGDGLGGMDCTNVIIDHCSVSWSIDECLSVYGCTNLTVQWCTSTHSLINSGHSKGNHGYGGNWGGSGATYHHNLISNHTARNPRLGPRPSTQLDERMDLRNCVMYNYGSAGCYGGEGMNVNIVNNYYKPGTVSNNNPARIAGIGIRTSTYTHHGSARPNVWDKMWHVWGKFYVDGNVNAKIADVARDNWTYGIYNEIDADALDGTYTLATKDSMKLTQPVPFVHVTTHTAEQAYEKVLAYAGNSLYRDKYDQLVFADVKNGTSLSAKPNLPAYDKGSATPSGKPLDRGFINSQYDVNYASEADHDEHYYPVIPQVAKAKKDSDGDGMPDEWERANGLNPKNAADGKATNAEGYTNLELYLNSLVAHITEAQNADGTPEGFATATEAKAAWQASATENP